MQILLNDPNRAGGSSQLDLRDECGVVGYLNAGRIALWASDINTMFSELYALLGRSLPMKSPVSFSQTIPLNSNVQMPSQSVTGALTFTPSASPVANAACLVRLTADGAHVPNFSAFTADLSSEGWVNAAGTVNQVLFWYDGTTSKVTIHQGSVLYPQGVPISAPGVASIVVPHGVNPTLTLTTNGAALNSAVVPPASAFTLASPASVTINRVAATANTITLSLIGTINAGDTVTLSYAPLVSTSYITQQPAGAARDANGNQLASFAAATVVVT